MTKTKMKHESQINNCALFALYAGDNPSTWKAIEGQEVIHTSFGRGVVVKTGSGQYSNNLYIWIRFESDLLGETEKQFAPSSFGNSKFFTHLTLPDGLDDIESLKEQLKPQAQLKRHRREPSEQKRKRDIQQICLEHNITTLIHFTRVQNLHSILEKGLLSRSTLEALAPEHQPEYNDNKRLEGYRGAICLSISFPNYRMFYKYSRNSRAEWVVLLLASSVLWELDCAFCEDNAATKRVRGTPLAERKQANALAQMLADCDQVCRQDLQIPDKYPTNPQAEVLVFDPIPPSYVNTVHFWSKAALQQWIENNQDTDLQILHVNKQYFRRRKDWAIWNSTQQDSGTVFPDIS